MTDKIARVRMPDGRIARFKVPETATPQDVQAMAAQMATAPPIPEVTGYGPGLRPITGTRETPLSATPGEAFKHATATEAAQLYHGAREIVGRPGAAETRARIAGEQAERGEGFFWSTLGGQIAPYMAMPMSLTSTLARAAATGGATGLVASGGDPIAAGAGALTGGLGYGAGQALARPGLQLTPFQGRSLEQGQKLGFKATPAQLTGNPALNIAEASMASSPLTANAAARVSEHNQTLINRIAAEAIGEKGSALDDVVLGNAADRIGTVFERVGRQVSAPMDEAFMRQMDDVQAQVLGSVVKTDATEEIPKVLDRIVEKADGNVLSGKQINKITSDLKKQARAIYRGTTGDVSLAEGYLGIANALDDLMVRHAPGKSFEKLKKARDQWRNLIDLERANVVKVGGVDPVALNRVLSKTRKGEYLRGRRQGIDTPTDRLYTAARYGSAFRNSFGNSGTAQRLAGAQMGAAWYGGTQLTGEPVSGAMAGLGIPALASRLYGRYPWTTGLAGLPTAYGPQLAPLGARVGLGLGLGQQSPMPQ